jgi:membrane-associated protease RseP (regulator of RpoE activity)
MMKIIKNNLGYLLTVFFSMIAAVLFSVPGYLGVSFEEITDEYAQQNNLPVTYGVYITGVLKGKGAEKAGIKTGDIILEIDNQKIEDGSMFTKLIAEKDPGEKINLKVMRDGKTFDIEAALSERPDNFMIKIGDPDAPKFITVIPASPVFRGQDKSSVSISGMYLQKLNPDLGEYFGVKDGYLIVSVTKDSGADKAGFKPGDVLQSIDNQPVVNNRNFDKIFKDMNDGKEFAFKIIRKNKELTLQMKSDPEDIATLEWFSNPLNYKIIAGKDAILKVDELEKRAKIEALKIEKEIQKIKEETKHLGTEEAKKAKEEALAELKERQKEIEKEMKSKLIELKVKDIDELNEKLESNILKKLEQKIKDLEAKMNELEKKLQEKEIKNK